MFDVQRRVESIQVLQEQVIYPLLALGAGILVVKLAFPLLVRFIKKSAYVDRVHPLPWQQQKRTDAVRVPYRTDNRAFTREQWEWAYRKLRMEASTGNELAVYWLFKIRGFL